MQNSHSSRVQECQGAGCGVSTPHPASPLEFAVCHSPSQDRVGCTSVLANKSGALLRLREGSSVAPLCGVKWMLCSTPTPRLKEGTVEFFSQNRLWHGPRHPPLTRSGKMAPCHPPAKRVAGGGLTGACLCTHCSTEYLFCSACFPLEFSLSVRLVFWFLSHG